MPGGIIFILVFLFLLVSNAVKILREWERVISA